LADLLLLLLQLIQKLLLLLQEPPLLPELQLLQSSPSTQGHYFWNPNSNYSVPGWSFTTGSPLYSATTTTVSLLPLLLLLLLLLQLYFPSTKPLPWAGKPGSLPTDKVEVQAPGSQLQRLLLQARPHFQALHPLQDPQYHLPGLRTRPRPRTQHQLQQRLQFSWPTPQLKTQWT